MREIVFLSRYGLFYLGTNGLYICVSFWPLNHEPRDIPQAETKITLVKGQLISKCFFEKIVWT